MAAWAGLGYYARARNLLACARAVAGEHGGVFPDTEAGLRALPGVGAYTAAAIAAIAFDRPANVVDGNVERVMARLFAVETPLPGAKPELQARGRRPGHGRPPRRLGPGADGPGRHGLPAARAALRRLPARAGCAASPPARRDAIPAATPRPSGRTATASAFLLIARRGGRPGAPPGQGPAGRHAGPADQRLARRAMVPRRGRWRTAPQPAAWRPLGDVRARLHPLLAGLAGVRRRSARGASLADGLDRARRSTDRHADAVSQGSRAIVADSLRGVQPAISARTLARSTSMGVRPLSVA